MSDSFSSREKVEACAPLAMDNAVRANRSPSTASTSTLSNSRTAHCESWSPPSIPDQSRHTRKKRPWRLRTTPFEHIVAERYKGQGTEEEPFIVEWLDDDPENPQTYSSAYKWTVTFVVAICTLTVSLSSSAFSAAGKSVIDEFHVSTEVFILGTSLFVLGFALGPLVWAPASEVFGRRAVFIFTFSFFTLWNGVCAASTNMESIIVFRFLAGAFGSSPLANSGGTLADMFSAKQRGLAMAVFASMPFLGPALGPITGGFIGDAGGWRWVEGFLGLFAGMMTLLGFMALPETYAPLLLRRRAALLSELTGKDYRSPMEAKHLLDIKQLIKTSLGRPWVLLFTQPIVTIYMSIVYAILYMFFEAFPIIFTEQRGWSAGVTGLAFLGLAGGILSGVVFIIFFENPRYGRAVDKAGGRAAPEERLPTGILGGVSLVVGLAWFAATCGPRVHFIVPILAGAPFGLGMVLVFLCMMNYLVDVYLIYAASVLAGNSAMRSLFGAAFPLFTTQMYRKLGIHWASAVPGFLALACLPAPIIFYRYGKVIRGRSKYAKDAERVMDEMMAKRALPEKSVD